MQRERGRRSKASHSNGVLRASSQGHESVGRLLLEKMPEGNLLEAFYGDAVLQALLRGHELVTRLLLEKGARIEYQMPDSSFQIGDTGELFGLFPRYESVITSSLGLKSLVIIEVTRMMIGNPLHAVCLYNSLRFYDEYCRPVVKVLLEKGADPNAPGG